MTSEELRKQYVGKEGILPLVIIGISILLIIIPYFFQYQLWTIILVILSIPTLVYGIYRGYEVSK